MSAGIPLTWCWTTIQPIKLHHSKALWRMLVLFQGYVWRGPWFYVLFQGYVWQPILILFFVSGICLTTDLDFMFCFRDMSDNRPWFYALFQGYVWQPTLILCFVSGICLTTDLDFMFHMNNGRYPRECDFGRFKFWLQSNTWQTIKKLGGSMSNTGNNIRYRRSLELFDIYKIKTKV